LKNQRISKVVIKMNLSSSLVFLAVPLKRWSMVFLLAMAAIYCALPGAARADFTLQYTGAAFSDTPMCGVTTDPLIETAKNRDGCGWLLWALQQQG
jgi:hypothetical protein